MVRRVEIKVVGLLKRFFAGLGYKFLALLLAFLIWAGLLTGRTTYRDVKATVDVAGVGGDMAISGDVPESIPIRIRGKGIEVIRAKEEDFEVSLRLDNFGPGRHVYSVSKDDIMYRGTRGVEVERILGTDEFTVEIQKRIARPVPVRVQFEGRPRAGYYVGLPTVMPERTTFFGPEPVVNRVDYVTVTVDVSGTKGPVKTRRTLEPPLPGITIIGPKEVEVEVNVEEGVTRVYDNVPVEVRKSGNVVPGKTRPSRVTVVVESEARRLEKAPPPVAYVEIGPEDVSGAVLPVDVNTGEYITLIRVNPAKVEYVPGE